MTQLRLALRSLSKTPLVSAVAILSLALGIGANAAIFSIFEQLILRSLPVEEPERLVNFSSPGPKSGSQSSNSAGGSEAIFSYPMYRDLETAAEEFAGIAAHCTFGANLAYEGETMSSEGVLVSGNYFEVLGLSPALGRLFDRSDDLTPGAHSVVVLDHAYWRHHLESDPGVVGRSLVLNGQPMTVVGVAPRGFNGTTLGSRPRIYVPISMRGSMLPGWEGFENRRSYWMYLFARLAPGISLEQASTAINGPYRNILGEVELPLQTGASERYLEAFKNRQIVLSPGRRGQSSMHGQIGTPLLLLFSVTAFVLLIACANLANLLLVKAAGRSSEIALRLSIGARRHQVVSQLLAESFALAALGSALAFLFAFAVLRFFTAFFSSPDGGLHFELGPPLGVFLAVLAILTGLVGLFPALHATRHDLALTLKSQSGRASDSRAASRFRAGMVTAQIALSTALLVSAGLFVRSLANVSRVELGIEVENLTVFGLSPELNGYTPAESRRFFERVEDEVAALPGVTDVAASMVPLVSGNNWSSNVTVEGYEAGADENTNGSYNEVGPGFFRTLGIPLLAGRDFTRADTLETGKVAIVNEAFARRFDLGREAVGKRMQIGSGGENDITIVGLVDDASYSEVKGTVPPTFMMPYRQDESLGSIHFYVRSGLDAEQLVPSLRSAVARLDEQLPVENLQTLRAQILDNVALDRLLSTLSAAFAVLATILAAIGLYGVLGYSVSQKSREIGLRMALGADAGRVRGLILRQVGWMTAAGVAIGVVFALGLGRAARSLLYEVEAHDPAAFAASVVLLGLVALAAGLAPAQRAASIDPMKVLREE